MVEHDPKVDIKFRVPYRLAQWLKLQAAAERRKLSDYLRCVLQDYRDLSERK